MPNYNNVYVVNDGKSNTSFSVTGLSRNTTYNFRVNEFNGIGETANYLHTTNTTNPLSKATSKKESEEIEITQTLNVYPNPVKDNLTIDLNLDLTNAKLSIINEVGQEVYSTTDLNKSINLNTLNYANGVYHIIISSDEESLYHSFVIEK